MKNYSRNSRRHVLITGGAGFIGINAAHHFLSKGWAVTLLDNLSRAGGRKNLQWLSKSFGTGSFTFCLGDVVNDLSRLEQLARGVDSVLHLAGQVAVTTSVQDPRADFEANAVGTLNVLEAVRRCQTPPALLYSSTNKVYGAMEQAGVKLTGRGYRYRSLATGIDEKFPLDFHSPYGCSKGAADQYVRDYARIYGLDTVTFRQSCVYGPRQFGMEDQGWIAWFAIAAVCARPITVYGDGWQTRDVLHVSDLCRLYEAAFRRVKSVRGRIYNVGGGPSNVLSLRKTLSLIQAEIGRKCNVAYADWRPGDQRVYISDIRSARRDFDWKPRIGVTSGVGAMVRWVEMNRRLFS